MLLEVIMDATYLQEVLLEVIIAATYLREVLLEVIMMCGQRVQRDVGRHLTTKGAR